MIDKHQGWYLPIAHEISDCSANSTRHVSMKKCGVVVTSGKGYICSIRCPECHRVANKVAGGASSAGRLVK